MAGTALLSSWRDTRLGQRLFCAALAMLLVLSEVFSSNIQATLPAFSHLCRVLLTGGAAALLLFKCVFLTRYDNRAQYAILAVALGYSGFAPMARMCGFSSLCCWAPPPRASTCAPR